MAEKSTGARQTEQLIELASMNSLFHSADGVPWATYPVTGHGQETSRIRPKYRQWLLHRYCEAYNRAPNNQAVENALRVLEARAIAGEEHIVSRRLAEHGGAIYLDLCDGQGQVVEISRTKPWRVMVNPPVKFYRDGNAGFLPYPGSNGDLQELRRFVNVASDDDFRLIVSWLVAAARPAPNYPVLVLTGEQGSAKTTTGVVLRSLIDPMKKAGSRGLPKDERDLAIAVENSHVLLYSNISRLPDWLSDVLCRIATGEGFATRKLYSDDGEQVFGGARPIILNGIEDFVERGDLLDRAIVLHLPPISERYRRDEQSFWTDFDGVRPNLLAGLLDAIGVGWRELPTTNVKGLPRMADFARWVIACESSLPWKVGQFLESYEGNRTCAVVTALDADPVAKCLCEWWQAKATPSWSGTATELLQLLNARTDEEHQKKKDWPKSPNKLSGKLRRLAPGLRKVARIDILSERNKQTRRLTIRLAVGDDAVTSDDGRVTMAVANNEDENALKCRNVMQLGDDGDANDDEKPTLSNFFDGKEERERESREKTVITVIASSEHSEACDCIECTPDLDADNGGGQRRSGSGAGAQINSTNTDGKPLRALTLSPSMREPDCAHSLPEAHTSK